MAGKPIIIAPCPFTPGQIVKAKQNTKHVPAGSVGRVAILSATGHPIVDFSARGRVLITAAELPPHDGPLPSTSSPDRVPLRAELPPREIVPEDEPQAPPTWCEPPDPALLIRPVINPFWPPPAYRAEPDSAFRKAESSAAESTARRDGWTEERRQRFRATMAAKRAAKMTGKDGKHDGLAAAAQPAGESAHTAVLAAPAAAGAPDEARADPPAEPREAPVPAAVAVLTPPDPIRLPAAGAPERPQRVMTPGSHDPDDERAFAIVSTRRVLSLAATRGLGSRTVLELARLLCQLDEEMG